MELGSAMGGPEFRAAETEKEEDLELKEETKGAREEEEL